MTPVPAAVLPADEAPNMDKLAAALPGLRWESNLLLNAMNLIRKRPLDWLKGEDLPLERISEGGKLVQLTADPHFPLVILVRLASQPQTVVRQPLEFLLQGSSTSQGRSAQVFQHGCAQSAL